ncbi:hypothetical protein AM593_01049, partial [Mytilus galloprovincialis]
MLKSLQVIEKNIKNKRCISLDEFPCTGMRVIVIKSRRDFCVQIAIVGACIGAIAGLVFFIVLIYLCCRTKKGTVGTVVTHPGAPTTVVGQQQYGQQAYGQPAAYGQPQYGQSSGFAQPASDPVYPPTKQ